VAEIARVKIAAGDAGLLMTYLAPESIEFIPDDLLGAPTRQLIARHLRGMHENSPPESVHAFDIDKLREPAVTFWSAWVREELAGCGALKRIDEWRGEVKSMRVADAFLGRGVGRAMLNHIIAQSHARGMGSLWLETGSAAAQLTAPGPLGTGLPWSIALSEIEGSTRRRCTTPRAEEETASFSLSQGCRSFCHVIS
jgi:putative acetyltransferase